ncbi:MAG: DNA-directed RNA polymerase subunit omega [Armatimonadetes bacterium]|nr:DNA-directed RNA polymerase subunit omega [Armatimonadota bacterium]
MIYPSGDELDEFENRYALVILAAKRACQLKDRARPLVDSTSKNQLTVALQEIAAGRIVGIQQYEEAEPTHTTSAEISTTLTALLERSDEEEEGEGAPVETPVSRIDTLLKVPDEDVEAEPEEPEVDDALEIENDSGELVQPSAELLAMLSEPDEKSEDEEGEG